MSRTAFTIGMLMAASAMAAAQAPARPDSLHDSRSTATPSVSDRLARHIARHEERSGFSGQVVVARAGRPIMSRSSGIANREWGATVTSETRFRIGSITKPFVAAAILRLSERGKLAIDDPVCRHLEACPRSWETITIRHLLSHTSGIPDYVRLESLRDRMTLDADPASYVAAIRDLPLQFAPGAGWDYSNSGYLLLALVLERVTGRSYDDVLQSEVFAPAGMRGTMRDVPGRIVPRRAAGYGLPGKEVENAPYIHMSSAFGAGDLLSTADDLLRFDEALARGTLVTPASLAAMSTPVKNGYGLGLMVGEVAGRPTRGHGGRVMGFTSYLLRVPEESLTVVVLSNFMDVNTDAMAHELAMLALGAPVPEPKALPPILVDPGPGTKGNVTFRLAGHSDAKFIALAGTFNRWRDSHTGFVRDGDGWVCRIELPPGRYEYKLVIDGRWMVDPGNPVTSGSGEYVNSVLVVR